MVEAPECALRACPNINFGLQFQLPACAFVILGLQTPPEYARLGSLRLGCEIRNFAPEFDIRTGSKPF